MAPTLYAAVAVELPFPRHGISPTGVSRSARYAGRIPAFTPGGRQLAAGK
ncbi:hypothetical protein [Hymenobacter profundi]|uniref:Uncharacterized protein n=1 Tax=Hymenobacter profundi TaxID=1982110 RepID=A0ABS6X161_9BACT|nr:hypothetical protein [Hymenobacter profundi]MBW3129424.1 hypothetical protein [Hymenobacter profundi]